MNATTMYYNKAFEQYIRNKATVHTDRDLEEGYREEYDSYDFPHGFDGDYAAALAEENLFRRRATLVHTTPGDMKIQTIESTAEAVLCDERMAYDEQADSFDTAEFGAFKLASLAKLRRHVRSSGGEMVAAWACTNRIQHGRQACDSQHLNEDVLIDTYRAALAGIHEESIQAVLHAGQQVLGADETAEHKKIEDQIIKLQEEALELNRACQNDMVSDDEYEAKVMVYSQRMADLQARQKQLKADATPAC